LAISKGPDPLPGPGEVLVRIGMVGICGSDLHLYRNMEIGGIRAPPNWILGHECMGTVEALGAGVDAGLLGRRVAVDPHRPCGICDACLRGLTNACLNDHFLGLPPVPGALREWVAVPAAQVEPIADHVSDEQGVLLEPLAIALHALRLVKPQPGESVAIVGTGVLGTCVLVLLKQRMNIEPICVDLKPDRLERASRLGASRTIQARAGDPEGTVAALLSATGGAGAQRVFECAGQQDTFRVCCDAAAAGAHVGIIGIPDEPYMTFPASSPRRRALTLRMVRRSFKSLAPCVEWMNQRQLTARELGTHIYPASRSAEAFEVAARQSPGVLKVMIDLRTWD
jgi:L-iditol 2-dehydrogenase